MGTIQNQVATTNSGKKTMQQYIKSMEGEIKKALPSVITPERFTRMVLTAISVNPKLAYGSYNNSSMMYNNAYSAYWRYYNRTHLPLSKPRKYF